MKIRPRFILCTILFLSAASFALPQWEEPLAAQGLHAFRGPIGDWAMAAEVSAPNPEEKRLVWTPGDIAAVNGENGHTSHLVTKGRIWRH